MLLTNSNASMFLAAGRAASNPLSPSLGAIQEQDANAALADSFFDVNFEIDLDGGFLYNQEPLRVETVIDCVSPKALYLHVTGCHALYTSPTPGEGVHLVNIVNAQHETFPDPCPDLGDCCNVHQGSGCIDGSCCQSVCAIEPSCCDGSFFAWDQNCADLAWDLCPICDPLGSTYSVSPEVRPSGQTQCQPVFDPATPGEPDDTVTFDQVFESIRTLINGSVPTVSESRFQADDDVTGLCFSMTTPQGGDLFPLPGGPGSGPGDGCFVVGGDVPLEVPPGTEVVDTILFADSGGVPILDAVPDPSVCTNTNDTLTCEVDLPGLAGMNVDFVTFCVDLAEREQEVCEATGDASYCNAVSCPSPGQDFCSPKCVALEPDTEDSVVTQCACVPDSGCRVLDPFEVEDLLCGGNCPPCETCFAGGGDPDEICCGCKRIGDFDGNGYLDMNDFKWLQLSFGRFQVPGTRHDCADIDGNGKVDIDDYFLFQINFDGPLPPVGP